ncbi:hypothetical protein NITHO_5380001 [Nitrolancea hollandica Lb]|uniref:Uncharacterized protein n=1 Tax=Nitrolancea hollandica Lb TaxID=1129897 RepID=I4ELW1_9BACT|nr:hypothetical protein NITHO_5380001 [Nitrolancea hollandica Lb]
MDAHPSGLNTNEHFIGVDVGYRNIHQRDVVHLVWSAYSNGFHCLSLQWRTSRYMNYTIVYNALTD